MGRAEQRSSVLEMAGSGPVTNAMVRQELGLDRQGAVLLLRGLVAEGTLQMRGSKRGSHYVLAGSE